MKVVAEFKTTSMFAKSFKAKAIPAELWNTRYSEKTAYITSSLNSVGTSDSAMFSRKFNVLHKRNMHVTIRSIRVVDCSRCCWKFVVVIISWRWLFRNVSGCYCSQRSTLAESCLKLLFSFWLVPVLQKNVSTSPYQSISIKSYLPIITVPEQWQSHPMYSTILLCCR